MLNLVTLLGTSFVVDQDLASVMRRTQVNENNGRWLAIFFPGWTQLIKIDKK
jgi:hypothetical protein